VRSERNDMLLHMLRRMPDPLALSAGAGARLLLAALLSAAIWAVAAWAMG